MKYFGMIQLLSLLCTVSFFEFAYAASPDRIQVDFDSGKGTVEFKAIGRPSILKIIGRGSDLKGKFSVQGRSVTGSSTFNLSSLDTGIQLRDEHMKTKYLQTDQYPQAQLTLTSLMLPQDWAGDHLKFEDVPFTGKLSLHGNEQDVSGVADLETDHQTLNLKAKFKIKLSDFKINVPSYAGVTVANEVEITVSESAPIL